MLKSDIHPPGSGPSADPVLYGVAAGLADLFPPVVQHLSAPAERDRPSDYEADLEAETRD